MSDAHAPDDLRVNDDISAETVRLVDRDGEQMGVLPIEDALAEAAARDLELVEVEASAEPPVCRLMTLDEIARRYAEDDEASERPTVLREIRVDDAKALADAHIEQARGHLERGDQLKLTISKVGRGEDSLRTARAALEHIADSLEDVAIVEIAPERAGRGLVMFLEPR